MSAESRPESLKLRTLDENKNMNSVKKINKKTVVQNLLEDIFDVLIK